MRSTGWKLQHLHSFQPYLVDANCFKQPKPPVQQHRHDVNVEFIGKASGQALLFGSVNAINPELIASTLNPRAGAGRGRRGAAPSR